MFPNKAKVTVVVILAAAALLVGSRGIAHRADDKKGPDKAAERLNALLKERLEVAEAEFKARVEQYEQGRVALDLIVEASARLLRAKLETAENKAARVAVYEEHLKRVQELEKLNKAAHDAGRVFIADYLRSKCDRLEVEIQLEREKAK